MTTLSEYDLSLIQTEARYLSRKQRLTRTRIPRRFWDVTWDQYEERDANVDVAEFLQEYASTFGAKPRMHSGRGLLLVGVPGVGKTMAASMLGVSLSDSGYLVRFISMADYHALLVRQITLQQNWSRYDNITAAEEWSANDEDLRIMREVAHLLIIDDVGKEHHTSTGYAQDEFDRLLRHRMDIGRPVVMTSNLPFKAWAAKYSESMESFIHEATTMIGIADAEDMRRRSA